MCVKQTPIPAEAKFDEATKRLVREGVPLSLSSIDRRALLEAVRLRSQTGGTVTVLTMGPPQARTVLVETLSFGADKAIHLTDPAFAGADTLATARALAAAIRKLHPDLVMCGRFTVDSETGQVPSELAEMLGFAQVTAARGIKTTSDPKVLQIERETDEGHENYLLTIPALISVTELIITSRRLTPEEQAAGALKPIETWGLADIGLEPYQVGERGSPTRVAALRSAKLERQGKVIPGDDPVAAAKAVTAYLVENGLFDSSKGRVKTVKARRTAPANADPAKAVWVVAEIAHNQIRPVTFEMLGKAQDIATKTNGEVAAVLVGGATVARHAAALAAYGADKVYVASDADFNHYQTEPHTDVLASAITKYRPAIVLMASTTDGRDWAPRVAARLGLGLTGDCVELEVDANGEFAQIKPAFGGNIVAPIYTSKIPAMATVRPGMLESAKPNFSIQPQIVTLDSKHAKPRAHLLEAVVEPGLTVTELDNASSVVGIGKGIGAPENIPIVAKLAEAMGGSIAASLLVASAKWVPPQLQIGLTGRALAPKFYIAVGVSGMPNHLFGVRKAQHIIAINNSAEAPIFKSVDMGVVGDWATVVPALTKAILEAKAQAARD